MVAFPGQPPGGARPKDLVNVMAAISSVSPLHKKVTVTADFASLAANTGDVRTFTVTGARPGHFALIYPLTDIDGLVFGPGKVTARDTVSFPVNNCTGSAIDPASQTYDIIIL